MTTIDGQGRVNAAPFSFVAPISFEPPLLGFATMPEHDTYQNLKEVPEFVVNVPNLRILREVWITGKDFPRGVDELERAGLRKVPSKLVRPPGVEECHARLECKLEREVELGDHVLIVGRVVRAEVDEKFWDVQARLLRVEEVKPLSHISGPCFAVAERVVRVR